MQSCVCELWAVFAWYCLGVYTVQTLIRPMFSLSLFPCFLLVFSVTSAPFLVVLGCVVAMCKHTLSQVLGLLLLLVQGLQSLLEFNWAARHSLSFYGFSSLSTQFSAVSGSKLRTFSPTSSLSVSVSPSSSHFGRCCCSGKWKWRTLERPLLPLLCLSLSLSILPASAFFLVVFACR